MATYLEKLMDIKSLSADIDRVAAVNREALIYVKGYIQGRNDQAQASRDKPPTPAA